MNRYKNYYKPAFFMLPMVITVLVLVYSYWETARILLSQWLHNDDFSHGILIIPLAGYLVYRQKERLARTPIRTDWRALPLLFLPALVYAIGELGADVFMIRVSIFLFVVVLAIFFYGLELVKALRFPLLFLFLALPLPGFVYRNITFPLQILSSDLSVKTLHALGILAYREGNVIDLGFTQLQVVEACNGLRFILPMLTLGILFAFWRPLPWWKRLVLVATTLPLSILANVIRIAGTGIASSYWGQEAAQGFFHGFSGWAVFMLAFALYAGIGFVLNRIPSKNTASDREVKTGTAGDDGGGLQRSPSLLAIAVALATILVTPPIVRHLGSVPAIALKKPLAEFPMELLGWQGRRGTMEEAIWDRVGAQDYIIVDYVSPGGAPLNFYTAYYEYQRKAGDFVHTPRLCLPGAGWFIQEEARRTLAFESGSGKTLEFNEMVVNKGGATLLVYFWFQGRGRNFTSEYMAKFYLMWDGLFRRRTDGALVRLVMSIPDSKKIEPSRETMDKFALAVAQELGLHLP
ncbi:MAG: VPLPA-CTERM-specific exosortase XrtD [Desulfobacteraceae bacterium]|nr:VPLPA-CTERM-specific exosortase XrtD [Desulfobacteraceae bacterium]